MQVEIWTDIICPWCGLGNHHLDLALARFPHADEVEVIHRSFQLDETAPVGVARPAREMLRAKGFPDAQIGPMTKRIEEMAKAAGLQPYIVLDNRVGNTSMAHELAAWAAERGKGKQAWDALYRAYFGEARSIFDVDALVALAGEIGLDAEQARKVLTSRRYENAVLADGEEARRLGASGVPFIVIDRKYAVSGAQPVEALLQALDRAWGERSPLVALNATADDAGCGPDGCAVPAPAASRSGAA